MNHENSLDDLVAAVRANRKYQPITPDLVSRLVQAVLDKGLSGKQVIKEVRNKLHQVGGAYFQRKIDYKGVAEDLSGLPEKLTSERVKNYCLDIMQAHSSTAERQPILADFYHTCLEPIAPITSILDLACGLNPLAIPWMPMAQSYTYQCFDIYQDMIQFLQAFFNHFLIQGRAQTCDLVGHIPQEKAQVAFVLKSIPCLEQLDRGIAARIMEGIQSEHILVSFPVHSLGGRNKGMPDFYEENFFDIIKDQPWEVQKYHFSTELAFLIRK